MCMCSFVVYVLGAELISKVLDLYLGVGTYMLGRGLDYGSLAPYVMGS